MPDLPILNDNFLPGKSLNEPIETMATPKQLPGGLQLTFNLGGDKKNGSSPSKVPALNLSTLKHVKEYTV